MEVNEELIEILAANEHFRWSKWQSYLHSCCIVNKDGSLTIPKDKVERWNRQINTDYYNLSEKEKQSDRKEALITLDKIKNYHKNNKPKGIVVAGFGAIGKTYLGKHYPNIIDLESGFYRHINDGFEHIDVEKRKGTNIRPDNPAFPKNYFQAIIEARKHYDIVLTSMHWELLDFYQENNIPYYIAFPEENSESILATRCYKRGNNTTFTEKMINNLKPWSKKIKEYKPIKILYIGKEQFLEDRLREENLI